MAAAVALENLRILEDEKIVDQVRDVTGPYLAQKWQALADHPLVGEAKIKGLMGSIALTPNKVNRARFKTASGTIGYMCRERCFANHLIMRHVGDRMVISPPLIISTAEIDQLVDRVHIALDETAAQVRSEGLWQEA